MFAMFIDLGLFFSGTANDNSGDIDMLLGTYQPYCLIFNILETFPTIIRHFRFMLNTTLDVHDIYKPP